MADFVHDDVLDAAVSEIADNATILHICSSQPPNYAGIASVTLGNKSTPTFTGPADGDTSGRKITVDAITDGSVTATGTASHFAIADGSRLLAAGDLAASQGVTSGNTFTLAAFDIEIPDPST